jgi:hypothetical protein
MQGNSFSKQIQNKLHLSEKDSNKMERAILEISEATGMDKEWILEFIEYGGQEVLNDLEINFQWNQFRNKIIQKLKPSLK